MQRSPFRAVAALILVVVIGLVVFGAYQAGLAVGAGAPAVAGGASAASGAAPYGMHFWGYGWGWGFPFFFHPFGFFFGLFFLFLVLWLVRALFWGGRGHRADWHGSWEDRRREAFEAWHRDAHARGESHGQDAHGHDAQGHDAPPPTDRTDRPGSGPTA